MTKARNHVLDSIIQATEPLSARQLCDKYKSEHDPATIYRALHFLEEKGRIDSFILYCNAHGTERYYVLHRGEHRHWFHCERCHRFTDLGECRFAEIVSQISAEKGLLITSHSFYAIGICSECRQQGS